MIIIEDVEIKVFKSNIEHYIKLYKNIKIGDIIFVKTNELIRGSHIRIKYICDLCDEVLSTTFKAHYKKINAESSIKELCGKSLCKKCIYVKSKQTMLNKYGHVSYSSTNKYKQKMFERFGVDNISQLQSVKDKKVKKSLEKFGVEHIFQSENFKIKSKITWMENYGVDNPTKNKEIYEKAQATAYKTIKYKDTDLKYQGSYELDFIEYCISNNIHIENGPSIQYYMDGKNRMYHSDFYLSKYNLIVEVKSTYTYNDDYDENILKRQFSIESGYNFLFIIDKDYKEFEKIINDIYEKENI